MLFTALFLNLLILAGLSDAYDWETDRCELFDDPINLIAFTASSGVPRIGYLSDGPGRYTPNPCSWLIETVNSNDSITVAILWSELELAEETDYLDFYDGPNEQAPYLGRYAGLQTEQSGGQYPSQPSASYIYKFTGSTNQMFIQFTTSSYYSYEGFIATFAVNQVIFDNWLENGLMNDCDWKGNCSDNGMCTNGQCECSNHYIGDLCENDDLNVLYGFLDASDGVALAMNWPNLTSDPCTWNGLFCYSNRISIVDLPSMNLLRFPPRLPFWIERLDLTNNEIVGEIPDAWFIDNSFYLGNFLIGGNSGISGKIPSQIALMSFVSIINIADCAMTGPLPSSLKSLYLSSVYAERNLLEGEIDPSYFPYAGPSTVRLDGNRFWCRGIPSVEEAPVLSRPISCLDLTLTSLFPNAGPAKGNWNLTLNATTSNGALFESDQYKCVIILSSNQTAVIRAIWLTNGQLACNMPVLPVGEAQVAIGYGDFVNSNGPFIASNQDMSLKLQVACPQGLYIDTNSMLQCLPCPQHATCLGDTLLPQASPGYFASYAQPYETFYACLTASYCLGNQCAANRTGYFCNSCVTGFEPMGDACIPCPLPADRFFLQIGLIILLGAIVVFLVYLSSQLNGLSSTCAAIDFAQGINVLTSQPTVFAKIFQDISPLVSFLNIDFQVFRLQCLFNMDALRIFVLTCAFPLMILPLFAMVPVVVYVLQRVSPWLHRVRVRYSRDFAINGYLLLLTYLQLPIATTILDYSTCTFTIDGGLRWNKEPDYICWQGEHGSLLPIAWIAGIIYLLGVPVLIGSILYSHRQVLYKDITLRRFSTLYMTFKSKWWSWRLFDTVRVMWLVGVPVVMRQQQAAQSSFSKPVPALLSMITVTCIYCVAVYWCRPFRYRRNNNLISLTHGVLLLVGVISLIMESRETIYATPTAQQLATGLTEDWLQILTTFTTSLIILQSLIILYSIIHEMLHLWKRTLKKRQGRTSSVLNLAVSTLDSRWFLILFGKEESQEDIRNETRQERIEKLVGYPQKYTKKHSSTFHEETLTETIRSDATLERKGERRSAWELNEDQSKKTKIFSSPSSRKSETTPTLQHAPKKLAPLRARGPHTVDASPR